MDQAKMARTESVFREVNEAIAKTAERFEAEETDFICECSDSDCAHRITVELEDYEEVRSEATYFLLAPDHHQPAVERVVERTDEFDVVEKVAPLMADISKALNPRAA
jgi:hypothetical protein